MAGEETPPLEATQEDADAAVLAAAKALEAAQVSLQEAEARRAEKQRRTEELQAEAAAARERAAETERERLAEVERGAAQVGKAANDTVVSTIVLILLTDYVFSVMLLGAGL